MQKDNYSRDYPRGIVVTQHWTMKNGHRNPIYSKHGALHNESVLLKMASEFNNDRSGMLSEGFFTRKGISFYPKHVVESVTQTTQGNNYISFRR